MLKNCFPISMIQSRQYQTPMGHSNTYTATIDLPADVSIPSLNTLYKPAKWGKGLYKNETAVKFQQTLEDLLGASVIAGLADQVTLEPTIPHITVSLVF